MMKKISEEMAEQEEQQQESIDGDPERGSNNSTRGGSARTTLPEGKLNPPEVQKIIPEHVVKKEDPTLQSLSSLRNRTFSG